MLTATKDLMLPATVTGSWPRPRWYDGGLWGRPLDTALLDVRFREQFLDAHSTVIADQERAGLDILTNGDYHLDEDFAGRSWHHYPLQRWKGFEHEELQYEGSREFEAQLVVRVRATEVFPNCPRYIHEYKLVKRSRFVPKAECETPVPQWKQSDWAHDVLPENDPANDPSREVIPRG